jgi:hypothetical protein
MSFGITRNKYKYNFNEISQTSKKNNDILNSSNKLKLPIINIFENKDKHNDGELVLNSVDYNIYYYYKSKWYAIKNIINDNLILKANDTKNIGGIVSISSGNGAIKDGHIVFNNDNTPVVSIIEKDLIIHDGCLKITNPIIVHTEVINVKYNNKDKSFDLLTENTPMHINIEHINSNSPYIFLHIYDLNLNPSTILSGKIYNNYVHKNSHIILTPICKNPPIVWLDTVEEGMMSFNIMFLRNITNSFDLNISIGYCN